ncbi:MAG: hypothetical protein RI947_1009, partial [Candidatus Parcubacteria bacterium]
NKRDISQVYIVIMADFYIGSMYTLKIC